MYTLGKKKKSKWKKKHKPPLNSTISLKYILFCILATIFIFVNTFNIKKKVNLSQNIVPFTGKRNANGNDIIHLKHAKVLIGILSGRGNFKRRALARKTWIRKALSHNNIKNRNILFDIVFILGSPVCNLRSCTSVTSAIIEEKKRFKDIIILSTPDTYKTSAMKMLEFYKYVAERLNSYSCLIKLDDDTLPNLDEIAYKLSSSILHLPGINDAIWWWGDFRFQKPEHEKSNPWYIQSNTLKHNLVYETFLPFFASGWGHVLSLKLVFYIANEFALLDNKMWMEDAALGIWFDQLAQKYQNEKQFCRIFDSNWGAMPDFKNCKDKMKVCLSRLLTMKDIVPYERSNVGHCANNLKWFETSWGNLQTCNKFCKCSAQVNNINNGYARITQNVCGNVLSEGMLHCGDSRQILSCFT